MQTCRQKEFSLYLQYIKWKIIEKEPQTLIKAKVGSSFKARALGVRKDTLKYYPVELFADFINNKILVKDG